VSPGQLIVQTSFRNPERPELNLQEAEVLWLLGFNIVNRWPEIRAKYDFTDPGGHHWAKFEPNFTREDMDNQIRPAAQATRAAPRPTLSISQTRSRPRPSATTRLPCGTFTTGFKHRTCVRRTWV